MSLITSSGAKYRHILIKERNYQALRQLGTVPESFNTIIERLLSEHNENKNNQKGVGTTPHQQNQVSHQTAKSKYEGIHGNEFQK